MKAKWILLLLTFLVAGCRTQGRWGAESSIATSIYPNAPYTKHEYLCEKIDLSMKLKREW